MVRKIFPAGVGNSPFNSFKLFFISEGYIASQSAQFTSDCLEFLENLYTVAPFNLTRVRPHWLSVYTSFTASNNAGPAVDTAASAERTVFESTFTSTTGLIGINQTKVNAFIDMQAIPTDSGEGRLSTFVGKGDHLHGLTGSLVVILLPSIEGHPHGGELENIPSGNDYRFVSVSKDGLWHQTILRTIASCFGLGDEYELADAEHLEPDEKAKRFVGRFNLQYFENGPPNPISAQTQWFQLLTSKQRVLPPSIHQRMNPDEIDVSLDLLPASPVGIEFYEGGGGFRKKVWRSAHDCLMRRKIGDKQLPTRTSLVPLCAVCRKFIQNIIW